MEVYIWIGIIFLAGFLYNYFYSQVKGKIGEFFVSFVLKRLPKDTYLVLNDIMLATENGTTQIDHIVISKYGIFVIETKNYNGWIYGDEYADKWTQNIFGKKYHFMNPIKQNYGHMKVLEKLLNLEESKFVSVVVFSTSSTLKNDYNSPVIYTLQVNKLIKKYKQIIIMEDVTEIQTKILSANINTKEARKNHISNINKMIEEYEYNICPKCGGKLINKKGRFGYFKGCSNYPNCTYISNKKKYK